LAKASRLEPGDKLEVWISTGEAEGDVWAASTVTSIDQGEFSVLVSEWADLDPSDPRHLEAYEEGPYLLRDEGRDWRHRAPRSPGVSVGESVEILLEVEGDGDVWAASIVQSVSEEAFTVLVQEWANLDPSDPDYEEAYEEGPFDADDEGDEWRRCAAPSGAGSAAERAAVEAVLEATSGLKRAGISDEDRRQWPAVNEAAEALYAALGGGAAIATDPRLVGDWELIGCTSQANQLKRGLTGLGAAPFTGFVALHWSISGAGGVTVRETLDFFGKPVILNELRGELLFSDDGRSMREGYLEADIGGQQKSPSFKGAAATLEDSVISSDGSLRLGRWESGGILVFRKMGSGELAAYLEEQLLPSEGGTYIGNPTWPGPVERTK